MTLDSQVLAFFLQFIASGIFLLVLIGFALLWTELFK